MSTDNASTYGTASGQTPTADAKSRLFTVCLFCDGRPIGHYVVTDRNSSPPGLHLNVGTVSCVQHDRGKTSTPKCRRRFTTFLRWLVSCFIGALGRMATRTTSAGRWLAIIAAALSTREENFIPKRAGGGSTEPRNTRNSCTESAGRIPSGTPSTATPTKTKFDNLPWDERDFISDH